MYYICTGEKPFQPDQAIDMDENFNFYVKLSKYSDSPTFVEMVDFISKLLVVDVVNRMTALEAL